MNQWNLRKGVVLLLLVVGALWLFGAVALAQDEPGVLLVAIQPDSPAAQAGLHRGDIVLRVDETAINDAADLRTAILALAPGAKTTLTILHGDDERQIEVTLGDRNGQPLLGVTPYRTATAAPPFAPGPDGVKPLPPVPPLAEQVMPPMAGMTVTLEIVAIQPDSPAAAAGLQPKEEIVAVKGQKLTSPQLLPELVHSLQPGAVISLTVASPQDGQTERVVAVELGESPTQAGQAYLGIQFAPKMSVELRHLHLRPDAGDQQTPPAPRPFFWERRSHMQPFGPPWWQRLFRFWMSWWGFFWMPAPPPDSAAPDQNYFFFRGEGQPNADEVYLFPAPAPGAAPDIYWFFQEEAPQVDVLVSPPVAQPFLEQSTPLLDDSI
ncbi:MAG: PDZ domain-containing protein [Caldilineaceae bacterium]